MALFSRVYATSRRGSSSRVRAINKVTVTVTSATQNW